jgi:PmbA protein
MSQELLQRALDVANSLGAADAEIVLVRDVGLDVEVAQGKLETLALAEAIGMGARLFTEDRRMGFAYTTALGDGVERVVTSAWRNARVNEIDEHNVLPEEHTVARDDWSEQDFSAILVSDKIEFCRELERKTRLADARVTQVERAAYADSRIEYTIGNSRGLFRTYRNTHCICSVVAAASEPGADSEMGWEFDFGRRFSSLRLDWVAEHCALRATRGLGGTPCETRAMPVVLDDRVAMQFLNVIGPALMANNVLKGKSLFAGRVGETIAAECVTLVDQNDLDAGMNRAPFDGEGASAQATVLVEQGVLRGYLHNAYTAHKMGLRTTANAGRGGFRSTPEVGATNCFLKPGPHTPQALIGMAGTGLFVTEAMGVHTADPISGDFSLGVAGVKIENGCTTRPVRGVTIAGNIKDLLKNIQAVGNDLRFFGVFGSPSVLISRLVVSGA